MRFSLNTIFLLSLTVCVALAWFIDHQRLIQEASQLQHEVAQLSVAHKDKTVRRQNVLNLISTEPNEQTTALVTALGDDDIRIAMEARAGLESMTKMSFRKPIPNTATQADILALMREEQTQWKKWFDDANKRR